MARKRIRLDTASTEEAEKKRQELFTEVKTYCESTSPYVVHSYGCYFKESALTAARVACSLCWLPLCFTRPVHRRYRNGIDGIYGLRLVGVSAAKERPSSGERHLRDCLPGVQRCSHFPTPRANTATSSVSALP